MKSKLTKEEKEILTSFENDEWKEIPNMDTEIKTLEKKLEKYKQLKQGLMQNLLTGKIRLV